MCAHRLEFSRLTMNSKTKHANNLDSKISKIFELSITSLKQVPKSNWVSVVVTMRIFYISRLLTISLQTQYFNTGLFHLGPGGGILFIYFSTEVFCWRNFIISFRSRPDWTACVIFHIFIHILNHFSLSLFLRPIYQLPKLHGCRKFAVYRLCIANSNNLNCE